MDDIFLYVYVPVNVMNEDAFQKESLYVDVARVEKYELLEYQLNLITLS